MTAAPDPRVMLYSKPGCHLCEDAAAVIARVCHEVGASWREEIPVTFVDGRQHDFWQVDEQRLRTALAGG